jgi:ribosomal protein L22
MNTPEVNLDDPEYRKAQLDRLTPKLDQNIFEEEVSEATQHDRSFTPPTAESMALVLDPDPRGRVRWERKKVIQMVHRNGRISRAERILRTEREFTLKSPFLPTGYKKLVHLSHQIAGKTLDDAMAQMKFSKKKFAAEVRHQLEEARDKAIVTRGMGLGNVNDQGEAGAGLRKIQTKDGKWMTIPNPTRMYVAQSWVGRGPIRARQLDYKGRGRCGIIKKPSTSEWFPLVRTGGR